MELTEALRSLRATRNFASVDISNEVVSEWLKTARWCGSSRNSQPWRFIVVRHKATKQRLARLGGDTGHLERATVVVVLAGVPGRYEFSTMFDLGRVAQNLMLAAHQDGIGSCIGVFEPTENIAEARRLLAVPEMMRLDLAIGFGYPAENGNSPVFGDRTSRSSPSGRLPLSQIVFWDLFD